MYKSKWLMVLFTLGLSVTTAYAQRFPESLSRTSEVPQGIEANGQQVFLTGDLGRLDKNTDAVALLQDFTSLFNESNNQTLVVTSAKTDDLGLRHERIQQYLNGLPVVGAQMIVHSVTKTGMVYAINGLFVEEENLPRFASVPAGKALANATVWANIKGGVLQTEPELTYVVDGKGGAFLAWQAQISYQNKQGDQLDILFADATGARQYVRHPQYHYAKNRRTYDANNGTSLPGTLERTEGQGATGDSAVDDAHDNAGTTYDYYSAVFGRDSYNDAGAQLRSTVHFRSNYNNAFWNGAQMVYGDGDGSVFSPLSGSLDVVAHELTHAVTDSESDLIYANESGAINEAMSDVFGAACQAWVDGGITSTTWKIGDEIYTPGTPGDALRYMDDPALAGDRDYYPDRYTGSADNGGVHTNSGIANLAFVLLVEGGTHPRGKTSNVVPSIGMSKAQQIFYRANTIYLGPSSNFEALRNACASSADDLYGSSDVDAVHEAFDAVGVPGGPGGGPGGGCSGIEYTGFLTGTGDQEFEPNGTYYFASSGTHSGDLDGTGADFDLYLWKWAGRWVTVASSLSATSTESINYSGSSGYYAWRVYSYSGSGSYTLCLDTP